MSYLTPILMVVFNRPELTQQVFEQVRKIKPAKLFIALDGPRTTHPEDINKCQSVKDIFNEIDWDCEVKTLYRNQNLGCHKAVPAAISWFFEQVDQGIILEDDCLPDESFFPYAEELLNKYRDNDKIMMISGDNFTRGMSFSYSYTFSKYAFIWGWATWKRAWKKFDNDMTNYPHLKATGYFNTIFRNPLERFFWSTNFSNKYSGRKEGWDSKWIFALISNNAYGICPEQNLVRNLGFGPEATTTKTDNTANFVLKASKLTFPLRHPNKIELNTKHDHIVFNNIFLSTVSIKEIVKYLFSALKIT